jgi:hypothetical protein
MATDSDKDKAQREARAAKLRQRIAQITGGGAPAQSPAPPSSPREFVERRAREEQERNKGKPPGDA